MTIAFIGKTVLAFALLHSVLQGQICLLLLLLSRFSRVQLGATP